MKQIAFPLKTKQGYRYLSFAEMEHILYKTIVSGRIKRSRFMRWRIREFKRVRKDRS